MIRVIFMHISVALRLVTGNEAMMLCTSPLCNAAIVRMMNSPLLPITGLTPPPR